MFCLELTFKKVTTEEYNLEDGGIRLIGRDPHSDIVVDDPDVSGNYAASSN
jgi:hypothetical protein